MSRYGLFAYGQGLYGQSGDGLYDARPIFAYSFPKSYADYRPVGSSGVQPYYPSDYSPVAVDPEYAGPGDTPLPEDFPDMWWGPSYFSKYLTDFYEANYGSVFIEPDLGSDFYYILLTWARPAGSWTDLAVVRRKFGPPETVDDGITVLTVSSGTLRNEFVETRPQGESVYYGIFVRTDIGEWKMAGYTEAVNCRNHDGLEDLFKAIPRIYTSATGGTLDVIDRRGQLSRFLQGLAFEYDYWKTQADRLYADPGRMPYASVALWAKQLGMTDLDIVTIGDRNLRRYLTSASTYSETKGTQNGIEAMATAITGWPVTATVSPNLMLDTDDSSAENSIGRWGSASGTISRVSVGGGGVTSPVDAGVITQAAGETPHLQGSVFTFAPSGATAAMSLGNTEPVNEGIPVTAGTAYKFNICWRSTVTTTGNLKADITWYDARGASISTTAGTNQSASASWQQTTTTTGTAPAGAAYAGITLSFSSISGESVYHLDMGQLVVSTVNVSGKFYDARAIDLNVAPIRTNYCTNPTFDLNDVGETNTSGWSVGTQSAAGTGYVGSVVSRRALSLNNTQVSSGTTTSTATSTFAADDPVTASVYLKATSGTGATSVTIPIKLECKNSGGTVLSTTTTSATVTPGEWQRISVTKDKAPSSTSYVTVTVAGSGTSASMTGAGSSLLVDGCLIEKRETLLSYFDAAVYGDTGAAKWAGTAHASISYLYPLRLSRQASLARIMNRETPEPCYVRVVLQ